MALQTSGPISLNEIHIEAGGSSGSTASINDSDIRGLINKSSGATMSFNEWYGASNVLWTPTMTSGLRTTKQAQFFGYAQSSHGSMNDYSVDFLSNSTLKTFRWRSGTNQIIFEVYGSHSNSGWTSWTTNRTSTVFNRSSGSYAVTAQGHTTRWTFYSSNPFGTNGQSTIITFN